VTGAYQCILLTGSTARVGRLLILETFFYRTKYPEEEVNYSEPSPSVSFPWKNTLAY